MDISDPARRKNAPYFDGLTLDIVVMEDPRLDLATSYRVTCADSERGRIIRSTILPAGPHGGPPHVTLEQIILLIGENYCSASVFVEIESERIATHRRLPPDRPRLGCRGRSPTEPLFVRAQA